MTHEDMIRTILHQSGIDAVDQSCATEGDDDGTEIWVEIDTNAMTEHPDDRSVTLDMTFDSNGDLAYIDVDGNRVERLDPADAAVRRDIPVVIHPLPDNTGCYVECAGVLYESGDTAAEAMDNFRSNREVG